jgi:hypothetical protein
MTFTKFHCRLSVAVSGTTVFTVRLNNATNVSTTCTVPGGTTGPFAVTGSYAFTPGQLLDVRVTNASSGSTVRAYWGLSNEGGATAPLVFDGGSGSNNIPSSSSPGANYWRIDTTTSTPSTTSTANAITPGVATTLKSLTFTTSSSSSSTSFTGTVGVITDASWAASLLTCTVPNDGATTSCTVTVDVPISATQSINFRTTTNGGGSSRTGTWAVTYTQP